MKGKSLSHVRLFATPWTAAYQAPLSIGFSRQEYWSGVPSPSPIKLLGSIKLFFFLINILDANFESSISSNIFTKTSRKILKAYYNILRVFYSESFLKNF